MAYTLYYTANFSNEISQSVEVLIYKKDGDPVDVENYELYALETTDNSEGQTKYECIIVRELFVSLRSTDDKTITWETFITAEHDTWKIEVLIDEQYYFHGFITPDEGNAPFQDKPYEVNFRATNGLALLKGQELSDVNGDPFDGDHSLIEYIAGALKKTGLDLPIRIYCGYLHLAMQNKADSLNNDMFQQADLNYRTFQSNPLSFVNCYEALKTILDKFCRLEYWGGMWVIKNIAELQYRPADNYYVDYDSEGNVVGGFVDSENYGRIGKDMDIFPVNETQQIYSRYAVKSVKTSFDYLIWPELPKNNKFERGTFIDEGPQNDEDDVDGDGDTSEIIGTYKQYTIDDWEFGKVVAVAGSFPFVLTTPDGTARTKRIFNDFNVEIDRQIIIDTPSSNTHWLRSEAIPVGAGDKIEISLEKKFRNDFTGSGPVGSIVAYCYVVNDSGGEFWGLSTASQGGDIPAGIWTQGSLGQMVIFYAEDQNSTKYASLNLKSLPIPVNGTLFVALACAGPSGSTGPEQIYRNVIIKYTPYVAGGYIEVKGDYWFRSQDVVYPDVIDDKVMISDSLKRLVKGALLFNNQLTDPGWYRHGPVSNPLSLGESRHFKELLNIARFNHSYRRMYALEGDFKGLNFSPENDNGNKRPIGFYTTYRETDMSSVREFSLVPPLKMDLVRGWINANLVEVYHSSDDGTQSGTSEFKYIFD